MKRTFRDDLLYLLETVDAHADKFPVPSHMRELVARIRATGDVVMIIVRTTDSDRTLALRYDSDESRVMMHVGTMDGGAIIPSLTVRMTAAEAIKLREVLNELIKEF
jgi:hypothetical protein